MAEGENAFLRQEKRGRELFVPEGKIHQVLPDWNRLSKAEEVRRVLHTDRGHLTRKVQLCSDGKRERMYCFRLERPDETASEMA